MSFSDGERAGMVGIPDESCAATLRWKLVARARLRETLRSSRSLSALFERFRGFGLDTGRSHSARSASRSSADPTRGAGTGAGNGAGAGAGTERAFSLSAAALRWKLVARAPSAALLPPPVERRDAAAATSSGVGAALGRSAATGVGAAREPRAPPLPRAAPAAELAAAAALCWSSSETAAS